ncbi:Yippee family putative zinc-binding protein [Perilla frutescens var. hirtella]|uniref:Protein yippee-like n=1 Tax=Perilla frutescens var. hirtella TaxID=608512 RepID=A0AAD4P6K5_PERFH|nr:Yippee family putative zinc-binding protein [Perilla frutescens var. hirtella]
MGERESAGLGHPLYSCRRCRNPLALNADLISKSYKAKSGQAYMFRHAMNVVIGAKEERQLMTGQYTISHIFCSRCGDEMGWTYVTAFDATQKFKEGKYILEKAKILKEY